MSGTVDAERRDFKVANAEEARREEGNREIGDLKRHEQLVAKHENAQREEPL